jgi:hypothetical protein
MSTRPNANVSRIRDLDRAVRSYRSQDLRGAELFRQWKAIRDASLSLELPAGEGDGIPGDDSY